jgi:homocysteine S-methyltransferase
MGKGILERLRHRDTLVLDGAVGTELQRRGVPMDSEAWCALATASHSELVVQIHADYIAAGAEIITTNTFPSARHVLEEAGLGEETASLNRAAVALAQQAVEQAEAPGALVAGSMSSMAPLGNWRRAPVGAAAAAAYREQAELLAEAGIDLLIAEMMLDLENAALVVEAAQQTGLPLLVGWSASPDGAGGAATYRTQQIRPPEPLSFDELMREGTRLGGDVHGIMHSSIEVTGPALRVLGEHWDGPTMAYAETGRFEPPNWVFSDEAVPSAYAETVRRWVHDGVQIVGGCCGTTPEHIAAISNLLSAGERPGG